MEERRSDTVETSDSEQPPGSVSNQNTEEAPYPDEGDGSGSGSGESRRPTDDPGSAKEGGQSTGHPENAG